MSKDFVKIYYVGERRGRKSKVFREEIREIRRE